MVSTEGASVQQWTCEEEVGGGTYVNQVSLAVAVSSVTETDRDMKRVC